MTAIHQFVPSFATRDAIGAHTLQVRRLLHDLGIESEVFVDDAHDEVASIARPYREFSGGDPASTYLLYQTSTGSPIARFLLSRPEPKIIDYHNITPARFFETWEQAVAAELAVGWSQAGQLASCTVLGLADSELNRRDLALLGYRTTMVAPILLDLEEFERPADQATTEQLLRDKDSGGADLLFVGRVAPHKAQHDIVKAFATYRHVYDPRARLRIVGGSASHAYLQSLESFIGALGLRDAVTLTGSVSSEALSSYFESADVFVCLSQHEGFCVPLLEAMYHRVPIVALRSTAVPETLSGAGIVLPNARPSLVAGAIARVVGDQTTRQRVVDAGTARLTDFALERTRAIWISAIESLIESSR